MPVPISEQDPTSNEEVEPVDHVQSDPHSLSPADVRLLSEWRERVSQLQSRVNEWSQNASTKQPNDQSWRNIYVDTELARMDFNRLECVATFNHAFTHTPSKQAQTELSQSQAGKQVLSLTAAFDEMREAFDISRRARPISKIEMYLKMFVVVSYTFLTTIAALYLMPLRLLHPLLRNCGVPNHFLPIDLVQKLYCRGFLWLCGVRLVWEGLDNLDYEHPMIGMFSHASNMDPVIVASGPYALKWIAKRSLFKIPLMGWTLWGWGHIAIDRNNREAAVESLNTAVATIHRYGRCIAISPEGTRSKSGLLQDFKKGPFHTCLQVNLPIQPILIQGAYDLWPPKQPFPVGGQVTVKLLPRIETRAGETVVDLSYRTRVAFLEGIRTKISDKARPFGNSFVYALWLPITMTLMWFTYQTIKNVLFR